MLEIVAPAPELAPWVSGYWFVRDLEGVACGRIVPTSANVGGVVAFDFAVPNDTDEGTAVPRAALLGCQTRARTWRPSTQTYFVMAMLTLPGLVRLFPSTGRSTVDRVLDLGDVVGTTVARRTHADLSAVLAPTHVRARLDAWFRRRLDVVAVSRGLPRVVAAHALLRRGTPVAETARAIGITRRQLTRWFVDHVGLGPKRVMELERLHHSIRALQAGTGDPIAGYSDQAHQIRDWKRYLGVTPGAYARGPRSTMAALSRAADVDAYYL